MADEMDGERERERERESQGNLCCQRVVMMMMMMMTIPTKSYHGYSSLSLTPLHKSDNKTTLEAPDMV